LPRNGAVLAGSLITREAESSKIVRRPAQIPSESGAAIEASPAGGVAVESVPAVLVRLFRRVNAAPVGETSWTLTWLIAAWLMARVTSRSVRLKLAGRPAMEIGKSVVVAKCAPPFPGSIASRMVPVAGVKTLLPSVIDGCDSDTSIIVPALLLTVAVR
jgi:hypothetical protein